jgi:chromosome segregation ATPase
MNFNLFAIGGTMIAVMAIITYHVYTIGAYKDELVECSSHVANLSKTIYSYEAAMQVQNAAISDLERDYNNAQTKLKEWKSKPDIIKYREIYKVVPVEVNITSEECEDVKTVIKSFSTIRFTDL